MISIDSAIFCFQSNTAWEESDANFDHFRRAVASAEPASGALLVFPEMATAGFSMNTEKVAEPEDGPSTEFFSQIASETGCSVIAGIPLRSEPGKTTNSAIYFAPDGSVEGRYDKMRPFSLVGENDHYTAGAETVVVDWNGWKVAPFVCYDLRFPELFRDAVKKGAEIFVVIANWPEKRVGHWSMLLRARAIENQAYVVGVNRCGSDPNFSFPGASAIVDPLGEIVASAGDGVETIQATLDRALLDDWRKEFPALTDAR